jgi:hypothetical protein
MVSLRVYESPTCIAPLCAISASTVSPPLREAMILSTQSLVRPAPVPTLVTVQPMVTRPGSAMVSVGALTFDTARSA